MPSLPFALMWDRTSRRALVSLFSFSRESSNLTSSTDSKSSKFRSYFSRRFFGGLFDILLGFFLGLLFRELFFFFRLHFKSSFLFNLFYVVFDLFFGIKERLFVLREKPYEKLREPFFL